MDNNENYACINEKQLELIKSCEKLISSQLNRDIKIIAYEIDKNNKRME